MVYKIPSNQKEMHDSRVSVLKKVVDKYNYENVNFPAGYDDVETFEQTNKVAVFCLLC